MGLGMAFHSVTSRLALAAMAALVVAPVAAQDCPELVGRWPFGPVPGITV